MQDQEERIAGAVSLGKSLESSTQVEGSSVDRSTGSSMGTGKQVDGRVGIWKFSSDHFSFLRDRGSKVINRKVQKSNRALKKEEV